MQTSPDRTIAARELAYTRIGDSVKLGVTICINEPFRLTEGSVDFPFAEGAAGCVIRFEGLPEKDMTVYGADTLQALAIAVDTVDKYLRILSKKYAFFFKTGEPYFED
ncbi:hypothetical protein [Burkholderia pseudomallei]|uniref:hypothetical protein n=1 Tax=Burkholderia pseudomallei TaxID=28450 RepID=UPI0018A70CAB|nr:hypothetical protein [Burkholderia pseudomallei]